MLSGRGPAHVRVPGRVALVVDTLASVVLLGGWPSMPSSGSGGRIRSPGFVITFYAPREARTIFLRGQISHASPAQLLRIRIAVSASPDVAAEGRD